MKIAFDESGNTGQNLLDLNQQYFALASVNFSISEINQLLKIFDLSAEELHFKSLKRHYRSQNQLLEFLNHDLINWSKVKYFIVDKEIALIGHIVDRFIEPVMYKFGKDIYQDRTNIIFTNLLYIFGKKTWNRNVVEQLYHSFQEFIRKPEERTINLFYEANINLINSIEKKDQINILNIIAKSQEIKDEILNGIEPYTIDLTFPIFNVLADRWFVELNTTFQVIHDNSKAIEFWKDMIDMLSNPNIMEEKEVGYGINKMTYPLKFTKLELVDSKEYREVQFADLIASSLCFGLKHQNKKGENKFIKGLWNSNLFNMFHLNLQPLDEHTLMQFIGEGDQDGISSLDYLAEILFKNK